MKIRRSETGEQLRVKQYVEDAQRSGIIACGGVGDKMWAALTVTTDRVSCFGPGIFVSLHGCLIQFSPSKHCLEIQRFRLRG